VCVCMCVHVCVCVCECVDFREICWQYMHCTEQARLNLDTGLPLFHNYFIIISIYQLIIFIFTIILLSSASLYFTITHLITIHLRPLYHPPSLSLSATPAFGPSPHPISRPAPHSPLPGCLSPSAVPFNGQIKCVYKFSLHANVRAKYVCTRLRHAHGLLSHTMPNEHSQQSETQT